MLLPHNAKKLRRKRTELLIRFPGNSVTPARAPAMQGFVDMHSRARRDQRSLAPSTVRESDAPHKITGAPLGAWAVLPIRVRNRAHLGSSRRGGDMVDLRVDTGAIRRSQATFSDIRDRLDAFDRVDDELAQALEERSAPGAGSAR